MKQISADQRGNRACVPFVSADREIFERQMKRTEDGMEDTRVTVCLPILSAKSVIFQKASRVTFL